MLMEVKCTVLLLFCIGFLQSTLCKNLKNATLTLLYEEVQQTGAVCLDGSPPGFFMRPGTGSGVNKWKVHLMGGGWCLSTEDCYNRSLTLFGSTNNWPSSYGFDGFLSDNPIVNPDFHDWNMVFVIYCDGSSFASDRTEPDEVNGKLIYYRGYRILKTVIDHLNKERKLFLATDFILTGCSAGGVAVYIHADFVHTMISPSAEYRALSDAGYFPDIADVHGIYTLADGMMKVLDVHKIDAAIIPACKVDHTAEDMWKCLVSPYIYKYIKTPIFVLNSQYDSVELTTIYNLPCLPPNCSDYELELIKYYEKGFRSQIQPVLSSPSGNGYFLDSCLIHCQSYYDQPWMDYSVKGHTMKESFGDWYYQRPSALGATRLQDCDFPCNPTCPVTKNGRML